MTAADLQGEMSETPAEKAERSRLSELATMVRSREAALFTGAGFSAEAKDREGAAMPDAKEMIGDLWQILYGEGEPDDSSLSDL